MPEYREIQMGPLRVVVYASENRPGGWTIDIDAPSGTDLLVAINDGDVFNQEVPE